MTCPYLNGLSKGKEIEHRIQVEFRPATPEEIQENQVSWFHRMVSFPIRKTKGICNLIYLIFTMNIKGLVVKYADRDRYFSKAPGLSGDIYVIKHPQLMNHVLSHHRYFFRFDAISNEPPGIVPFLKSFLQIGEEVEVGRNDCVLTCFPEYSQKYRDSIRHFINRDNLSQHTEEIHSLVIEELEKWKNEFSANGTVNITVALNVFASSVISKLLLGYKGPYDAIARSVNFLFEYLIKSSQLSLRPKTQLNIQFAEAQSVLNPIINEAVTNPAPGILGDFQRDLDEQHLTLVQKRIFLLNLFMAGQETTAALATYILWQLALHPEIQDQIVNEIDAKPTALCTQLETLHRVFLEGIRLFTPAFFVTRSIGKEMMCTIQDETETRRYFMKKNDTLVPSPGLSALDSSRFSPDPETFRPDRHQEGFSSLMDWRPFGGGAHACPGQMLAQLEIKMFIFELLKRYRITTQQRNVGIVSLLTQKLSEEIIVNLQPRLR